MLCRRDYAESLVASFPHQTQSKYYSGNRYVSIEGIVLEHFSALPKSGISASTKACQLHAVLHSFLLDDSKQYSASPITHRKRLIEMLK